MKVWTISPKGEKRISHGHPWVFSNELTHSPKGIDQGELIALQNNKHEKIALGYGNPASLIAFRKLAVTSFELLPQAMEDLLVKAANARTRFGLTKHSYRLCYSEADGLSGLVVDRFVLKNGDQVFSVQVLTAGMERILAEAPNLWQSLADRLHTDGIAEIGWNRTTAVIHRSSKSRLLEGIDLREPEIFGNLGAEALDNATIMIQAAHRTDLDLPMRVSLVNGQKTGFFLDQAWNVKNLVGQLGPEDSLKVLDLFCYVGQWGAQIAQATGGATQVTSIDASGEALKLAQINVESQGGQCLPMKMDILRDLGQLADREFDIVICDPPALIKTKKDHSQGKRAYVKVNQWAMERLKVGGLFVSTSCSQHLSEGDLDEVLQESAFKAKVRMRYFSRALQGPDHPILLNFPQGSYLKGWIGLRWA
jgi:23S rRNA (cytosine1962-C5)-methyltransferase